MRDDYTGVPHTCPKIDEVIDLIDELHSCAVDFKYSEDARKFFDAINLAMEEIRTANQHLRDLGNEKAKEVDELENELENSIRQIAHLEAEIKDLNDTIGELEDELAEVKYG